LVRRAGFFNGLSKTLDRPFFSAVANFVPVS